MCRVAVRAGVSTLRESYLTKNTEAASCAIAQLPTCRELGNQKELKKAHGVSGGDSVLSLSTRRDQVPCASLARKRGRQGGTGVGAVVANTSTATHQLALAWWRWFPALGP